MRAFRRIPLAVACLLLALPACMNKPSRAATRAAEVVALGNSSDRDRAREYVDCGPAARALRPGSRELPRRVDRMETADEQPARDTVRMGSVSFLALGDSYTIGEGVPEAERWPVRLAEMLGECGIAVDAPRIIARTGWTTDELDAAIDEAAPSGLHDLVSLLIGVNNQYRGRPADEYREQFAALLARAIGFAGGDAGRVIVLSIPDWGVTTFAADRDGAAIAREIDRFNAIAREEAERAGAHFVDITPASRAAAARPGMLADDGLHPSGAAYEEWAALVVPVAVDAIKPGD